MIILNNIYKVYNKGQANEVKALNNLNLTINDGEMIAIIGKSGSGKSTFLHVLAGIDSFDSGDALVDEVDLSKLKDNEISSYRNKTVGIVLQNFALINDFSVVDNIKIPLLFTKYTKKKKKMLVDEIMMKMHITELEKRKVSQLSGGQKQRVAIARALVNNPKYILADEPTGSLDFNTGNKIFELLKSVNEDKSRTIIIVTHDNDIANKCDRVITIVDGKTV